jgi:hypothetical protein
MDKLQLTGQNLGRVFNFRFGHLHDEHFWCYQVKPPNLKLKTHPKQLLGSLPLVIALPDLCFISKGANGHRHLHEKNFLLLLIICTAELP